MEILQRSTLLLPDRRRVVQNKNDLELHVFQLKRTFFRDEGIIHLNKIRPEAPYVDETDKLACWETSTST